MYHSGISIDTAAIRLFNEGYAAANKTMEQLATGLRINRGADDPSGLISSEYLRSSLAMLEAETRSLERADMMASVADGAMGDVADLLGEAESLAIAAANTGATTVEEREAMQLELDSIMQTIDRLGSTSFAGQKLFDGNATIGPNGDSYLLSKLSSYELGLTSLTADGSMSLVNGDVSSAADALRTARQQVTTARGSLGSFQKDAIAPRIRAISIAAENTSAAVSVIRDTEYAAATSDLARQNVLFGAAGHMLGVSASNTKTILDLLMQRLTP